MHQFGDMVTDIAMHNQAPFWACHIQRLCL
uniref:Uncharacterized protein n=1 Tax=Rhizophora mucronata TaxID=61149 RepID=A0A2P2ITV5_RHIMU